MDKRYQNKQAAARQNGITRGTKSRTGRWDAGQAVYWDVVRMIVNMALQYVDTIRLFFPFTYPKGRIPRIFGLSAQIQGNHEFLTYWYDHKLPNGHVVKVKYWPNVWGGRAILSLEFSVQKVVLGNNFQPIPVGTDILKIITESLTPIAKRINVDLPPLLEMQIGRLDVSYNFHVGEFVRHYISYGWMRNYPHRTRMPYWNAKDNTLSKPNNNQDNGITFAAANKRVSLYDKELECGDPGARGLVRLEASAEDPEEVKKLFQKGKGEVVQLMDLTPELCLRVLQNELRILGFDHPIPGVDQTEAILRSIYSADMADKLYLFVQKERMYKAPKAKLMAELCGHSVPWVYKYRQLIRDADISVSEAIISELPALKLPDHVGESCIIPPSGNSGLDRDLPQAVETLEHELPVCPNAEDYIGEEEDSLPPSKELPFPMSSVPGEGSQKSLKADSLGLLPLAVPKVERMFIRAYKKRVVILIGNGNGLISLKLRRSSPNGEQFKRRRRVIFSNRWRRTGFK